MDIVATVIQTMIATKSDYILDDIGMIERNAGFQRFNTVYKKIIETICRWIQNIFDLFGLDLRLTSNIVLETTLDFWRNNILGRSSDMHSHLLE